MIRNSFSTGIFYIFSNRFNIILFFLIPFFCFSAIKFAQLNALNLNVADFGYFINHFEYLYEDPGRLILGHFQPSLIFFKIFYDVGEIWNNGLEAVLLVETLILAASIFLSKFFFGTACSILLFFHPALWAFLIFDFHIDVLILPLIILMIALIDKGKHKLVFLLCFCTILVKEVYLLIGFGLAAYGMVVYFNDKKLRFSYIFLSIVCLITLYFIKFYLINTPGLLPGDVLTAVESVFPFSLTDLSTDLVFKKIKFLVIILGPVVLVGLYSYKYLIIILPLMFVYFISANEAHFNPYAHYGLALCLPVCIAVSNGLRALVTRYNLSENGGYFTIILLSVGFHMLVTGSPISRLFYSNKTETFNYQSYFPSEHKIKISELIKGVDLQGKAVSVQNNSYLPSIKKAKYLFLFPRGVPLQNVPIEFTETFNLGDADYALLDRSRIPFVEDTGCNRIYMKCLDKELEKKYNFYFNSILNHHEILFKQGEIYFFKIIK